jgi:hypothetical protein
MENEKVSRTVTVTPVERPARKLILKRTVHATDYFSMCEEIGCDWEGIFNSIPEKLDTYAGLDLPPEFIMPGTGSLAFGVEVPLDYAKPIPSGCDVIDLPPCTMLYFVGATYEDENDFGASISIVREAMSKYKPEQFGWKYAPELSPKLHFSSEPKTGTRMAVPVRKA